MGPVIFCGELNISNFLLVDPSGCCVGFEEMAGNLFWWVSKKVFLATSVVPNCALPFQEGRLVCQV